jgi:hypothetical protein
VPRDKIPLLSLEEISKMDSETVDGRMVREKFKDGLSSNFAQRKACVVRMMKSFTKTVNIHPITLSRPTKLGILPGVEGGHAIVLPTALPAFIFARGTFSCADHLLLF